VTNPSKVGGTLGPLNLLDRVKPSSVFTPLQAKVDLGVGDFVRQASDWKSLVALTAGGMAYRAGRIGELGIRVGAYGRTPLQIASIGLGLTAEVLAFELTNRALQSGENPNLWRWNGAGGIRQGLLQSSVTFGALKGAGRLARSENFLVQHLFQDLSMVLGHQASGALGLAPRPAGSLAEQFLHAEATTLQIGAGMALIHRMAPGLSALERGLDLAAQSGQFQKSGNGLSGKSLVLAGASAGSLPSEYFSEDFLGKPKPMQMATAKEGSHGRLEKDLLAEAGAAVKKLAEKVKEEEGLGELAERVAEELHKKALTRRWDLLPEEKKFLLSVANRQIDEFREKDRFYLALRIFTTLHNFPGLRRLAKLLDKDHTDKREILMILEDYEEAYRLFDESVKTFYKQMPDLNVIFHGINVDAYRHFSKFGTKRGYDDWGFYSLDEAASALSRLAGDYDLVISIASGGLFSGAMAEFLGLPVRVIEVHAHGLETPTSKFVDEIRPEDIAGKRILFVDKDTITGASLKEAMRLIAPYGPRMMGAFFNYEVGHIIPEGTAKDLRRSGLVLHFPDEVEPSPTLPLFYRAHENLGTTLGKFRKAARGFEELIPSLEAIRPEAADKIRHYLHRQRRIFFAFNPLLPGIDRVRDLMTTRLESLLKGFSESRKFDESRALENLLTLTSFDTNLPMDFAGDLAHGRYHEAGLHAAWKRGVQNIHAPHSYTASFRAAQSAAKDRYDVALIVGPEGFAYEPIFQDLGLPTVAVNIPEADFGGKRSIAVFNDLSKLTGKRVLVVEDDVQSGATLKKLLDEIRLYDPGFLGLYLGLPAIRQRQENIPPDFKKIYVTEIDNQKDEAAFLDHLKKREVLFKEKKPPFIGKRR